VVVAGKGVVNKVDQIDQPISDKNLHYDDGEGYPITFFFFFFYFMAGMELEFMWLQRVSHVASEMGACGANYTK
jgi:hypothetical protein